MTRPTYGSLFSGVGGMDMGFDTHMDCVFQVEWDKHAQSILRRHWPDVPKWEDVQDAHVCTCGFIQRGIDGGRVEHIDRQADTDESRCTCNGLPACDVLTFGSPCQDLSVAGKRAGLDGDRSSMFYEAVRIIKEMRDATSSRPTGPVPRVAVWENVPGALSSNGGKDFGVVLDELAQLGAVAIEWRVLDAQHFGVPQRRRRVFVVAIFDPATAGRGAGEVLPVCEGRPRDFAKGRKKGEEPSRSVVDGFADGGTFRRLAHGRFVADDVASCVASRDYKSATDLAVVHTPIAGSSAGLDIAAPLISNSAGGMRTTDIDGATFVAEQIIHPIVFDATRHDDFRTGATEQTGMTHTYAVRRLTPLECERLMGWPDDHTRYTDTEKEQADTHRYKQCGNGVATPVARWIAGHLKDIL